MNIKKLGTKAVASVLTVATVASMAAISAGAADYGEDPHYSIPDNSSYTTPVIAAETANEAAEGTVEEKNEAADASILTEETIAEAVAQAILSGEDITVEMATDKKGNLTLMEDTIAKLVEGGIPVTLKVDAVKKGEMDYEVTIDPKDIKDVGAMNLGMSIKKTSKVSSVNGVKVPTGAVVIKPKAKGDLGATVKVTVPKDAIAGMKVENVRLYAVSPDGSVVKLPDNAIKINPDGSVEILVDTGDLDLVISDKDVAKAAKKHGKSKGTKSSARTVNTKSAAVLGMIDLSAISAAAIVAKKKKKK